MQFRPGDPFYGGNSHAPLLVVRAQPNCITITYMRNYNNLVPQPRQLRTLRDVLREHLNHARITQAQLADIWGINPQSARRLLNPHPQRPNNIKPAMITAVVKALKLDPEDAQELYWLGALEMGFKIGKVPTSRRAA